MYNAFKYVVANEGVDTEQEYSFAGKVSAFTMHTCKYYDIGIVIFHFK